MSPSALLTRAIADAHRWQEFSVLPDRWKDPAFGGAGLACMLFVDVADGHGVERAWVGIADSIGATSASRQGAHNGWHAEGDVDYYGKTLAEVPSVAVAWHGGQAGTIWDMYAVRGGDTPLTHAAGIGSRLAVPASGLAVGRDTRVGPTPEMLSAYYKVIMLLTGDVSKGILGPFGDNSQDDIGILRDFALGAAAGSPRGIWVQGGDFVASENETHSNFLLEVFGTQFSSDSYSLLSGNLEPQTTLQPQSGLNPGGDAIFGGEFRNLVQHPKPRSG